MTVEQDHMGRVARLGCIACMRLGFPESPAEVHHIREGRQARSDFLILPLCPPHHRGQNPAVPSIHHRAKELLRQLGMFSEFDLLAIVMRMLAGGR